MRLRSDRYSAITKSRPRCRRTVWLAGDSLGSCPGPLDPPALEQALADVTAEHRFVIGDDDLIYAPEGSVPQPWEPDENATATINYTSGTTARPKGVQITHRNIWTNAVTFGMHAGVSDRDVYLHTLPMFHANGWGWPFVATQAGAKHVVIRKIDGAEILRRVEEHGVTVMCAAPAVAAAKKAFIVNRVGDWGFVLGIFLIFFTFGTLDFRAVAEAAAEMPVEAGAFGVLSVISLLLFVGAVGKSAQIPLFVWLPDAMEGPTPVSALIHAATMVTAGVYLVARCHVLYELAPYTMYFIAGVGIITAIFAGSMAMVQYDIKRVIAYSTMSQLGYMFLAMGLGVYSLGMFHLMTHAFFKALLFMAAGSVIHSLDGEQDLRKMGGLQKVMPLTHATFLIGALALAGFPLTSGYFSKEAIILSSYHADMGNIVFWAIAVLTAGMTAFYISRVYLFTFFANSQANSQILGYPPSSRKKYLC